MYNDGIIKLFVKHKMVDNRLMCRLCTCIMSGQYIAVTMQQGIKPQLDLEVNKVILFLI